jgi:two-component system CheB/CheR fusion protein
VLAATRERFSIEYPCHSPDVRRWFLLLVAPLAEALGGGAVVMHLDITERRRNEESLRLFRSALDVTSDGIALIDRATMRFVEANAAPRDCWATRTRS